MNFVIIMTDQQSKSMVGCYGNRKADTPNIDRLASAGIRFDRAYTACPLCTPARSAIFSGTHPQVNGAWANNMAPSAATTLMGTLFRHYGYRAAYTGKWHLDGTGYFGDGVPGGGFEPDWWYDGKRYADDIGPEMFGKYRRCRTAEELREAGFDEDHIWGHRVADRAIDFLETVGDAAFALVASFDEPHGPYVAPPEYWERFCADDIPGRPNFLAPLSGKPSLQQIQGAEWNGREKSWPQFAAGLTKRYGCNSYVDREIGRVLDAVSRLHGGDTTVIYMSDHGDQFGSHGLHGKGPMMYEESCGVPLLISVPGGPAGVASEAIVSTIDVMPTMMALAGLEPPDVLQGVSLAPVLARPHGKVREAALISFNRFAINHDGWGELYPIRCAVDSDSKLAVNLFESDEFYNLASDPYETENRIEDSAHAAARDRLHDWLLAEMDRIRDPFRSFRWGARDWRCVRRPFYHGGARRNRPADFPFTSVSLEADGSLSGAPPARRDQ
ncbi:MAG: sulfatase-like hydrolase/transferase [Kiritimatiellae bacterium]|nr:sulfatase-like hydrolase/transferase [Kiritimatiellia bacterium]